MAMSIGNLSLLPASSPISLTRFANPLSLRVASCCVWHQKHPPLGITRICCSKIDRASWRQSSLRLVVVWSSSNGASLCHQKLHNGSSVWSLEEAQFHGWGSPPAVSSTNRGGSRRFSDCRALRKERGDEELPPRSREEAVEQAGASVSALLEKALKRQGPSTVKQRKEQKQVRLRVEIPVLDDSPATLVSLTLDLLASSFINQKKTAPIKKLVFLSDTSLLNLALERQSVGGQAPESLTGIEFKLLVPENAAPAKVTSEESQVLFIVTPKLEQAAIVAKVLEAFNPCPVVVLNPDWSSEDEAADKDRAWGTLISSFEVTYSYVPLAVQGIFSKTEGAVLKHVKSGAPAGRPWLIFVKQNDQFICVSSLRRRPQAADLESALYNSMAANSPVTKSIRFLRGLVSKQ